jgi:iron complex transport system permease protein
MSHYSEVAQDHGSAEKTLLRYKQFRRKYFLLFIVLAITTILISAIALLLGPVTIGISDIINIINNSDNSTREVVLLSLRLPRIVTSLIAGWGLALAGAVMQGVLRNPLSSPFTLGISHGASFGAALAIVVMGAGAGASTTVGFSSLLSINNVYLVSSWAFIGSLLTTAVVLLLARIQNLRSDAIILAGIALSSLFTSGTILLQYFADDVELAAIVFWTFGDVSRAVWNEIAVIAGITIPSTLYLLVNKWNLNALSESDDIATSLGINSGKTRLFMMIAASLMTSVAVAFNGVIAFLGLLAPHIARKLVGDDMRFLLPVAGLMGSMLLVTADTLGRLLIASGSLPVGVITSFLGAPFFILLLLGKRL